MNFGSTSIPFIDIWCQAQTDECSNIEAIFKKTTMVDLKHIVNQVMYD